MARYIHRSSGSVLIAMMLDWTRSGHDQRNEENNTGGHQTQCRPTNKRKDVVYRASLIACNRGAAIQREVDRERGTLSESIERIAGERLESVQYMHQSFVPAFGRVA